MQPSGPSEPPYEPPYEQPPPPDVPRAPLRPSHIARYVVIAIVAVVIVGLAWGFGIPLAQQSAATPKITLTDAAYTQSGCGLFGPYYYTFRWTFTLVNTGNANGFASVMFYVNGDSAGKNQYFVPLGSQITRSSSVNGPDHGGWPCPSTDRSNLTITSVTKA